MKVYQVLAPEAIRLAIEDAISVHLGDVKPRRWHLEEPVALLCVAPAPGTRERKLWEGSLFDAEFVAPVYGVPVIATGLPGYWLVAGRKMLDGVPVITVPDLYDAIYELGAVLG